MAQTLISVKSELLVFGRAFLDKAFGSVKYPKSIIFTAPIFQNGGPNYSYCNYCSYGTVAAIALLQLLQILQPLQLLPLLQLLQLLQLLACLV